MNWITVSQKQT